MKKYKKGLLLAVLICSILAGCSIETKQSESTDDSKYQFYYLNESETALKSEGYQPEEETTEFMLMDLIQKLGQKEAPDGEISLLPEAVAVNSYHIEENLLIIDFSEEYLSMSKVREVITRAGIVKILLQVPDIRRISFTVAGNPLTNSRNQEIGEMTADTFAEYSGSNIENYRYDTVTLYFADESGKNLVSETRNVYYRRALSKERVVLEQLAKGPMEEGHYAVIPDEASVLDVITSDGICYVDMSSEFQNTESDLSENVLVYSIVSSLIDSCDEVDRVQISIEGSLDGNFQENLSLYKFYEKNEEIIVQDDTES